jgi:hypothetical protein
MKLQEIILSGTRLAGMVDNRQCTCGWSSQHREELLPTNTLNYTISDVLERMEKIDDPVLPGHWVPCGYRWHVRPDYRGLRSYELDEFKNCNDGLSIDGIRSSIRH